MTDVARKILVVEDSSETRRWFVRLIETALGENVIAEAATVAQARAYTQNQQFAIAFIDLNLQNDPRAGITLIAEIMERLPDTYCVVTTMFDDDRIFAALRAGAQGYLLKEQSDTQLIAHLRGLEKGEPPISPAISRKILDYFSSKENDENKKGKGKNNKNEPSKMQAEGVHLTKRETEVLLYVAKGLQRKEIADVLGISVHSVSDHIRRIYKKLQVTNRSEATIEAVRMGLIDPSDNPEKKKTEKKQIHKERGSNAENE